MTNAAKSLDEALERMKHRGYNFPIKKERASLPNYLAPGELVLEALTGKWPAGVGLVTLTSERLLLLTGEFMGQAEQLQSLSRNDVQTVVVTPKKFISPARLTIYPANASSIVVDDVVMEDAERMASRFTE